ncbi:hypothetical protein ACFROC_22905 [Nocardia tengchongensis]|uniref:hypothetical protein n=1 Tax=Nocardia tengchongensis TaxID=2055889 RepID=UPI0036BAFE5A
MNAQEPQTPKGVVSPEEFMGTAPKPTRAPGTKAVRTSGSGRLSAQIPPITHRAANIAAQFRGMELRDLVAEALEMHPDVAPFLEQLREKERQAAEAEKPKK